MEKFQEIDIKSLGNSLNEKDKKLIKLNNDNMLNNENVIINVPHIPPKIQEPECKIKT